MCTVTYLPLPDSGFLLTSSRDEKTARPAALFPVVRTQANQPVDGLPVCFPQDPQSTGTWIAASAQLTVCLLNGAYRAHMPTPPYRHSRGLVVLDVFSYSSPAEWLVNFNFANLEPFTLVLIESVPHQAKELWEVRWDGQQVHTSRPNPQTPHIWSSATLYSNTVIARRQQWFRNWLRQHPDGNFNPHDTRTFHKQAGAGDDTNAVLMNRGNGMQTVSLTTVWHQTNEVGMGYEDFLTNTVRHQQLPITHEYAPAY